jgi:hypothetical protein
MNAKCRYLCGLQTSSRLSPVSCDGQLSRSRRSACELPQRCRKTTRNTFSSLCAANDQRADPTAPHQVLVNELQKGPSGASGPFVRASCVANNHRTSHTRQLKQVKFHKGRCQETSVTRHVVWVQAPVGSVSGWRMPAGFQLAFEAVAELSTLLAPSNSLRWRASFLRCRLWLGPVRLLPPRRRDIRTLVAAHTGVRHDLPLGSRQGQPVSFGKVCVAFCQLQIAGTPVNHDRAALIGSLADEGGTDEIRCSG